MSEEDKISMQQIAVDVDKLKTAMLGDGYGNKGYVSRIGFLEDEVKSIKRFLFRYHWMIVGMGMVGTGIMTSVAFIWYILEIYHSAKP